MPQFVLPSDLLTNHPDIDAQHKQIFDQANRWFSVEDNDPGDVAYSTFVTFLLAYIRYHFLAEERAAQRVGYPRLDHHRRQHEEIRRALVEVSTQKPSRETRLKVHFLVTDWFVQHIRICDKQFASWMREHAQDCPLEADLHALGLADLEDQLRDVVVTGVRSNPPIPRRQF